MLKSYLNDCDLAGLDYHGCDELYRSLPPAALITKRYAKPMAYKTCQNLLSELTRFLIWLHREIAFDWRKPDDFELIKKQPQEIDDDAEKQSRPIPSPGSSPN